MANNSGKILTIIIAAFVFIILLILYFSLQEIENQAATNKAKEDYLNQQILIQKDIISTLEKENKIYKDNNIFLKDCSGK